MDMTIPEARKELWVEWEIDGVWYGASASPARLSDALVADAIRHLTITPERYFQIHSRIRVRLKETEF